MLTTKKEETATGVLATYAFSRDFRPTNLFVNDRNEKESAAWVARFLFAAWFCVTAGCAGNGPTISPPPPPAQLVLAYTRPASATASVAQIDTRLSADGTAWSLPVAVSDGGGSPVPVQVGVPPGLATDGRVYQVAWFDPSGVLNTRISSDGGTWSGGSTHGSPVPVDHQSRPTLAVGRGLWLAAVRLANDNLIVQPLDGSSSISLTNSTTTPSTPLRAAVAPALAYGNGTFVLTYIDAAGVLRTLVSTDGRTWPAGPGTPMPSGVIPPPPTGTTTSGSMSGAPYLTFGVDGLFHLASTRVVQTPFPLFKGQILTFRSSTGAAWILESVINPSTSQPVGLAIANTVIVEPVPRDGTVPDVFVNGTEIDPSPLRPGVIVDSPVSLVHGPR